MLIDNEKHQVFREEYGQKSGVDYIAAKASGVNQDAFKKVEDPIEIQGELVLKIWNNKGMSSVLWTYLLCSKKEGYSFPLFGMKNEKTTAAAMAANLGDTIQVSFKKSRTGKCYCSTFKIV